MLKKILFLALLITFAAVSVFAQSKTNRQIEMQIKKLNAEKHLTVNFDEQGGTSKIFATGEDFGSAPDKRAGVESFSFGMAFFYAGETLNRAPDEINLTFWVLTKKPRFAEAHNLTVFAGGETLDLGAARYAAKPKQNMEYLNFKISRENLAKIAKASAGKLKIGNAEFQFTPEHLKTFAALIKISDPAIL